MHLVYPLKMDCFPNNDLHDQLTWPRYEPDMARYEDIPKDDFTPPETQKHKFCISCHRLDELRKVNVA